MVISETCVPDGRFLLRRARALKSAFILTLACCCGFARGGGEIVVSGDGSTKVHLKSASSDGEVVFRFGLPPIPPVRMWREQNVIRALWLTNGIRYTQTVLVTSLSLNDAAPATNTAILLLNVHGENTNKEYAEATAELAVQMGGKRQDVELNDGLVWRAEGHGQQLLGALEIPDSGVKVAAGKLLRFSGNIPPALQGSMTLKFPLQACAGPEAGDRLKDIDFDAELRNALKPGTNMAASMGLELKLPEEWKTEK